MPVNSFLVEISSIRTIEAAVTGRCGLVGVGSIVENEKEGREATVVVACLPFFVY